MALRLSESCGGCSGSFTIEDVSLPTARKLRDEWREAHKGHRAAPRTFGEAFLGAVSRNAARAAEGLPPLATGGVVKRAGPTLVGESAERGEQVPGQLDLIDDGNAAAAADVLDDAADVATPPMAGPDGELPPEVRDEGFDGLVPNEPPTGTHCQECRHEVGQHGMAGCHAVTLPDSVVCECRGTPTPDGGLTTGTLP